MTSDTAERLKWLLLGERVMRALLCGIEPSALMVQAAAERLIVPASRGEAIKALRVVAGVLGDWRLASREAWDRWEEVVLLADELEALS